MLLTFAFDDSFAALSVDPALQAIEFIDRGLVRLFQLFVASRCFIEHSLQLRRLLKSDQQEAVALGQIVGKGVSVIHNAHCFNRSRQL
jgi:hypothetical protein